MDITGCKDGVGREKGRLSEGARIVLLGRERAVEMIRAAARNDSGARSH